MSEGTKEGPPVKVCEDCGHLCRSCYIGRITKPEEVIWLCDACGNRYPFEDFPYSTKPEKEKEDESESACGECVASGGVERARGESVAESKKPPKKNRLWKRKKKK